MTDSEDWARARDRDILAAIRRESEATLDDLAKAWTSHHWEDLFPQLGSYDFAREAFKAGYAQGRDDEANAGGTHGA